MNIILILIPITLILVSVGILVFNWAVKNGQYDDLEGPAHRILYDDDRDMIPDDARQPQQEKRRAASSNGEEKSTASPPEETDQNNPKA